MMVDAAESALRIGGHRQGPTLYFDNSALGRLTDRTPELAVEAAMVSRLVRAVVARYLRFLSSQILARETTQITDATIRDVRLALLDLAYASVLVDATLPVAERLAGLGLHLADALHLAAAAVGGADVFVTCDAHFFRRRDRLATLLGGYPAIVSPTEAVGRFGL